MRSSDQKKNPPSEPDLGNLPHSTLIADPLRWIKRTVEPGERASEDYRNLVLREKWKCVVIRELHTSVYTLLFFCLRPSYVNGPLFALPWPRLYNLHFFILSPRHSRRLQLLSPLFSL